MTTESSFYVTGGTLRHDAPSYVERQADKDIWDGLLSGEFCYVLTSRQMGKSSLMVRTTSRLRKHGVNVIALDLTAIGQNLTPEQWYGGLLLRIGQHLRLEDELEDFWLSNDLLSPVQRLFMALRELALVRRPGPLVIFVDEIDTVRSLPFSTDEFFSAIRECYNRRTEDPELNRLTFCLLGVATPADLIRDSRTTPFNIGRRIELSDFTSDEAAPLARGLTVRNSPCSPLDAPSLLERILHWTNGHPYLTQRFLRALADAQRPAQPASDVSPSHTPPELRLNPAALPASEWVDRLCEELFLTSRARERDDNLLFVRERILRSEADLASLLGLYEQVRNAQPVRDDDANDLINHLRLAGIVGVQDGHLVVRNRIYSQVFDGDWVAANMPDAELEKPNGDRVRIRKACSIGRSPSNDVALLDEKVSRRHAMIQVQKQQEFWLVDLGSSNGTYLNDRRVTQPVLLRDQDQIDIGPFRLAFRQPQAAQLASTDQTTCEKTIHDVKSAKCWLLVATLESTASSDLPEELPKLATRWIGECRKLVEETGGSVSKLLGDGFLACWPHRDQTATTVVRALQELRRAQGAAAPRFRIALHYGQVFLGRGATLGEEGPLGKEVSFVLRLEKLAASLREPCMISEAAASQLKSSLSVQEIGRRAVEGFEGSLLFFKI